MNQDTPHGSNDPSLEADAVSTTAYYRIAPEAQCVILSHQYDHANNASPIKLEYLNEGGANFIFRFIPRNPETNLPNRLRGRLLRLPKHFVSPPRDILNGDAWSRIIEMREHHYWVRLLGEGAVLELEPIFLCASFRTLVNLHLENAARAQSRGSVKWIGGMTGFLTTDMTAREDEELHEFKPKWLAQSPNAPRHAKRCRTCALRAKRAAGSVVTNTDRQSICPLYLLTVLAQRHLQRFTDNPHQLNFITKEALPVLRQLREHQLSNDPTGILGIGQFDDGHEERRDRIARAMTSRDCTIYGRCNKQDGTVEVRVGDLDMKLASVDKVKKWMNIEKYLAHEGWYDGPDEICLLSNEEDMAVVKSCYEPELRKAVFGWTD